MTSFLEPYNPQWKTEFETLKQALKNELSVINQHVVIEHIGSTSIPGLIAKSILDIDIIIENKSLLQEIEARLHTLGYLSRGEQGISGRFAFRQKSDQVPFTESKKTWQTHHLYVCYADSLALKNHIIFRDALKSDKGLLLQYSELKKSLTQDSRITREEYTIKKTKFILSVLAQAGLNAKELEEISNSNL